jgi:hypothetical protein
LRTEDVSPALAEIPVADILGVDDCSEHGGLACGQFTEDFAAG